MELVGLGCIYIIRSWRWSLESSFALASFISRMNCRIWTEITFGEWLLKEILLLLDLQHCVCRSLVEAV